MEAVGIIPARYDSTRLPGKMLADIAGKPMIQHVYERAKAARLLDDLYVACDDDRVMEAVKSFGGKAVLTSKGHSSGTDRLTEVANPIDARVIINIQGDEPLIHPTMIDGLVEAMNKDKGITIATVIKETLDRGVLDNPDTVKVVIDKDGYALYFSRSPIPAVRSASNTAKFYKHIGIYGYTKDFLFTFTNLPPSPLEKSESLEQLRALENGYRIKTIETKFDTISVDTERDLEKVRKVLCQNTYL
ncbi:MAG: 3-deoxy-manno-octulosonate cytidylyltransferase [Candidatus Omnitrophica bacterium CG1_02_49_10]|nr:MAG: 3-deoxy-manno-octulosonate cytidylyltransferase [Candidatus Omnitrophica bacterium CG1_02_49_10]